MSFIDTLKLDTFVDLSGARTGFNNLRSMRDEIGKGGGVGVEPPAALEMPRGAVPDIAGDFKKALAPLAGLIGKQAAVFEKMAGSILATNRRLDGDLKFEAFQANVSKLRARVLRDFDEMSEKGQKRAKAIDMALGAAQGFSKFKNGIETMISLDRKAASEIDRIKPKLISFGSVGSAAAKGVAGAVDKTHSSFKNLAIGVGLAVGPAVLFSKAFGFIKDGVAGAANLNESVSKVGAIFQDAAPAVNGFADSLSSKFGLIKQETLDVSAGFGGLFKGLGGQSGEVLARSTQDMSKLAADLSSYANISFGEAGQALRVALSGETSDILKGLGVVTTDSAVEAYAYASGIGKIGTALTDAQKMAARTKLVFEGLGDASGDLDRTAGSTSNRFRFLTGSVANLATSIGQTLLPIADAGMAVLSGLVGSLASGFESSKEGIAGVVDIVADKLLWVATLVEQPGVAFQVLRLKAEETFTNIGGWVDAVWQNFANQVDYVGRVATSFFSDLAHNGLAAITNIGSNFAKLGEALVGFLSDPMGGFNFDGAFTPLTEGFRSTVEKLPDIIEPALVDMSKEIAKASKPLDDAFAKKQKLRIDAKAGGGPAPGMGAAVPKQAAISEELGEYIKQLRDGIKTPLEKYQEATAKLTDAYAKGLINKEEFDRGDKFNRKEAGFTEVKFAAAQQMGSTGAYSTIIAALVGRGNEFQNKKIGETAKNTADTAKAVNNLARVMSANANPMIMANLA